MVVNVRLVVVGVSLSAFSARVEHGGSRGRAHGGDHPRRVGMLDLVRVVVAGVAAALGRLDHVVEVVDQLDLLDRLRRTVICTGTAVISFLLESLLLDICAARNQCWQ